MLDDVLEVVQDPRRLRAVRRTALLDTPPDPALDRLAALAARLLGAPLAFVTLVDERRSFWKSAFGLPSGAPRENAVQESFCQYVIARPGTLLIGDAANDPRTRTNPSVRGMGVAAWAGTTLRGPDGEALGSFCVVDDTPREWSDRDAEILEILAEAAGSQIARGQLADAVEWERRILAEVVLHADVGIAVLEGRELVYRLANGIGTELMAAVVGRPLLDVFPQARAAAETSILPVFDTGREVTLKDVGYLSDDAAALGGRRFFDVTYSPIFGAAAVEGVLATYVETTDAVRSRRGLEDALASERNVTAMLQRSLLPRMLASVAGLQVAARYRPADDRYQVGGDFYDLFAGVTDEWVAAVGDVCGKGPEAAVSTGLARWTLRSAAASDSDPAALAVHLNEIWRRDEELVAADAYLTLALVRLVRRGDGFAADVVCAGHPPVLLIGPDASARTVGGAAPPIGIADGPVLEAEAVDLAPGSTLVLYSDGLLDAQAPGRQLLPEDLIEMARGTDPGADAMAARLLERATAGGAARDDIALLVVRNPG